MLPDLIAGFTQAVERVRVEEMTPEDASAAIRLCVFLQGLFAEARQEIEEELSRGVDARAFAARYKRMVAGLDAILLTHRGVTKAQASELPSPGEQFIVSYQALLDDLSSLHQLLAEALAKAKLPVRPVDWKRVQEAEDAYAKGQTKPFQPSGKS
jgi:hypothetical protein